MLDRHSKAKVTIILLKLRKKKMKNNYRIMNYLNHGIFRGYTLFSCGFSYDEIVKTLKKDRNSIDKFFLRGLTEERHKQAINTIGNGGLAIKSKLIDPKRKEEDYLHYIILGDKFNVNSDQCIVTLAHECLHIGQFFLPTFLDRDEEKEAEAHFHSHLMKQSLDLLRGN